MLVKLTRPTEVEVKSISLNFSEETITYFDDNEVLIGESPLIYNNYNDTHLFADASLEIDLETGKITNWKSIKPSVDLLEEVFAAEDFISSVE